MRAPWYRRSVIRTISATLVARVWDVGVRAGLPPAELQALLGRRRDTLVRDTRVPIAQVYECFAAALRVSKDPGFPIEVATTITLEDYSVLGFALMTSTDGAEAFDRLQRYGHFITDSGEWQHRQRADEIQLIWHRAGPRTLGHRAANECALAELLHGLRGGIRAGLRPKQVTFRHAAPADVRAHVRFFGCPITWGAGTDSLVVPADVLALTARNANPAMRSFFDTQLGSSPPRDWSSRVRTAIQRELSSGAPEAATIARDLGVSARTLRRCLLAEHTSFRHLLDETRRELALELLRAGNGVTDTAFLLGFSETSAFSRAFRRWYEAAPGSVRSPNPATRSPTR